MKHRLRAMLFVCCAVLVSGCGTYDAYQRAKQLRTYTDLQVLVADIEEEQLAGGLTPTELRDFVKGQRDAWGNELRVGWRASGEGLVDSYVVLSLGADGRLDVETIEAYFEASRELIAGDPDRDIVFRDGRPLKNAGK